jgi:hypothetical protein
LPHFHIEVLIYLVVLTGPGVLNLMPDASSLSFSSKLQNLSTELQTLDHDLKSNLQLDAAALREFRQALDNIRLTAWIVSELLNARQIQRDPKAVISFLTAERLRRFSQMVKDLCGDMDHEGSKWPAASVDGLRDSVSLLQERLGQLAGPRRQTAVQDTQDE